MLTNVVKTFFKDSKKKTITRFYINKNFFLILLICSVLMEESKWLFMVLQCDGGRAFTLGEKGACRYFNTPMLKPLSERGVVMCEMWQKFSVP